MEHEKNIYIIIAVIAFCIIFSGNIYSSIQSFKYRRLCDELRGRVTDAEDTNKRLAETVEKCQSICGELGCSIDRNISSAREAVELIEQIRAQVYELENCVSGLNYNKYYNYWDSYYHNEGLME